MLVRRVVTTEYVCALLSQHPTNPDFLAAAKHFQECLTCIYENARCFTKLQVIWNALLSQPAPPLHLFTDIAEVTPGPCSSSLEGSFP
jgi:hypothetical protein